MYKKTTENNLFYYSLWFFNLILFSLKVIYFQDQKFNVYELHQIFIIRLKFN